MEPLNESWRVKFWEKIKRGDNIKKKEINNLFMLVIL